MTLLHSIRSTPLLSPTHPNFHSRNKSQKIRPTFIVCVSRIDEELQERRGTRKSQNQDEKVTSLDSRKPTSELLVVEKIFNLLDRAIIEFLDPPLHLSVDPSHILSDNFAPVDELSPTECKVIYGSIPPCLDGVYIRNGPNPQFVPNGPYHYFDGDGMVHCIRISQGRATFCSRYVKTNKYLIEQQVKSYIVPNVIGGMRGLSSFIARATLFAARVAFGHYDIFKGIGVANTSLALLGGQLCALCESDIPYAIKIKEDGDIITLGHHDFTGKLSMNMTAHPKIDPETKEAFAFRYWATRPYLTYFHFDANGNKQPDVPIFSMNHPSLTHDLAITQKYAIICEIQIGTSPNFNIFHAVNAWDETDEDGGEAVVMVAPNILSVEHFFERADLIHGSMEKVKINIETGVVSRHIMSNQNLEFPVINPAYIGKKNKYTYAATSEPTPIESRMIRVSGVVKLDITSAEDNKDKTECMVASRMYGNNCFGGEPFFIARDSQDPNTEEDDGYVVSYVHNESSGESSFLVMDARSPTLEVVAEVKLPQRVPYGLHGIFIKEQDLNECDSRYKLWKI